MKSVNSKLEKYNQYGYNPRERVKTSIITIVYHKMKVTRNYEISNSLQGNSYIEKEAESQCSLHIDLTEYMEKRDSLGYQVYPGTEPEEYDFSSERHKSHPTNIVESTAHLIKGCLGAGVLSMHVGFMYAGLWTALISTVIIGILVSHTMMMLVSSAHKMYVRLRRSKLSYPDLAEVAIATGPCRRIRKFSKLFRYTVDICLFAEMCGSCCIYEIMIADTLKQFLESVSPAIKESNLDIRYYLVIVAVPLILLCLIRNLKYLAPFSLVADVVVGICVLATMYYSLKEAGNITDRPAWKSFQGFISFSGVCLYSIDGMPVVMPVENSMKSPRYFFVAIQFGMATVIVLVCCLGFFGYWGWGEECRSPITIHMPTETLPIILQFLLAIMLSVTFAIHFWVPFRVVWYYIGKKYIKKRGLWERVYRTIHVLLITCLAVAFPNLIKMMIFIGNFFLAFVAFIFPALIQTIVYWKEPRRRMIWWMFIKNGVITVIGIFFCVGAFYSTT